MGSPRPTHTCPHTVGPSCRHYRPPCIRMSNISAVVAMQDGSGGADTSLCQAVWNHPAPFVLLSRFDQDESGPTTTYFFCLRGLIKVLLISGLARFLRRSATKAAAGDAKAVRWTFYPTHERAFRRFVLVFWISAAFSLVVPYPVTWRWNSVGGGDGGGGASQPLAGRFHDQHDADGAHVVFVFSTIVWCVIIAAESSISQWLLVFLAHGSIGSRALRHANFTAAVWWVLVVTLFVYAVASSFRTHVNQLPWVTASLQLLEAVFALAILLAPPLRRRWRLRNAVGGALGFVRAPSVVGWLAARVPHWACPYGGVGWVGRLTQLARSTSARSSWRGTACCGRGRSPTRSTRC